MISWSHDAVTHVGRISSFLLTVTEASGRKKLTYYLI